MAISQVSQVRDQLDDPPDFLEAIGDEYKLSLVAPGLQGLMQDRTWSWHAYMDVAECTSSEHDSQNKYYCA